jgi:hypothetical protein
MKGSFGLAFELRGSFVIRGKRITRPKTVDVSQKIEQVSSSVPDFGRRLAHRLAEAKWNLRVATVQIPAAQANRAKAPEACRHFT